MLITIVTIITGISLGFLYAQFFLYQKNTQNYLANSKTNSNHLENKNNWQTFLIKTTSQSLVRILAILAIFYLLLSWAEINFILIAILFLAVFWITILRNIPMA